MPHVGRDARRVREDHEHEGNLGRGTKDRREGLLAPAVRKVVDRHARERRQRDLEKHVDHHPRGVHLNRLPQQHVQRERDGHGREDRRDEQRRERLGHVAAEHRDDLAVEVGVPHEHMAFRDDRFDRRVLVAHDRDLVLVDLDNALRLAGREDDVALRNLVRRDQEEEFLADVEDDAAVHCESAHSRLDFSEHLVHFVKHFMLPP